MDLILGMDVWVFLAWIGTIIAAIVCVLYGLYDHFIKSDETEPSAKKNKKTKTKKEEK